MEDFDRTTGEVLPALQQASPLQALPVPARGTDLDIQIQTARAYPRDLRAVQQKITQLATIDEQAAEECLYALVRGKKRKNARTQVKQDDEENRPIEGPSIRLAEIAAQMYGNCRFGADVVEVNRQEGYVKAEGYFHDLESNSASRATIKRNIKTSSGNLFSQDMIIVTGNAACAIAKRNAILAGIPRSIYRGAYNAARQMIAGDAATVPQRWAAAVKMFAHYGVKEEQLLEHLGLETTEGVTGENLVTLRGMFATLRSGEANVEEMFSADKQSKEVDKTYDPLGEAAGQKQPADQDKPKLTDDELERIFGEGKAAKAEGKPAEHPYEGQAAEVWMNGYESEPEKAT